MSENLLPGMTLPDYELPDENGVMHKLSELQGDDLMVLMLGRGEHCPRERQHQFEMLKLQQFAPVAFTTMVTVLPNDLHDTYKMKIATGAYWTYLADADLAIQSDLDIREYTDPHHAATVPHTLILGPGRMIEKAYVGYYFWGRPSAHQLWLDLQEVASRTYADFDPTTDEARAAWAASQSAVAA
jgi:peroxiredoxin